MLGTVVNNGSEYKSDNIIGKIFLSSDIIIFMSGNNKVIL